MNHGPWMLTPEGAAVHAGERLAVIADVHLGYEWSRASGGDMVPAHSLAETVATLGPLLERATIERLVVAGDLVESTTPCVRTARDVRLFETWLAARGVALVWLRGNHDPPRRPALRWSLEVDSWTIHHGHRNVAGRTVCGHYHPALRVGAAGARCFLVGRQRIVLPAFSENAAGLNVASRVLPTKLRNTGLRCLAAVGDGLLDFGPVRDLRSALTRV